VFRGQALKLLCVVVVVAPAGTAILPPVAAYDVDGRTISFSIYQFSSGFDKVTIGAATG
jgi:hypothetical protein